MVRDGLTQGVGVIKDVSEATDMLAPLKATCALIERALEITKVYIYTVARTCHDGPKRLIDPCIGH